MRTLVRQHCALAFIRTGIYGYLQHFGEQEPIACKAGELANTGRVVVQQQWSWRCVSQHERNLPRPKAEVPTSTQERATSDSKTLQDEHCILTKSNYITQMGVKRPHAAMDAQESTAGSSPIMSMFEGFRAELDEHHDRRERIIKASRDITASSKKM